MNDDHTYDAIVIGAGMSGSWAAKELCDKGIKTLLLERGRDVRHLQDYPTAVKQPWEFKLRGNMPRADVEANPIAASCYAYRADNEHFFIKDDHHPYIQDKPFQWIRGYQTGGKSIMWARQTQRWSEYDFEGPARDGFAVDWPIRYADIAPWYSHVEKFVGITGNRDGVDTVPDGDFLPAWGLTVVHDYFANVVKKNYKNRHVIFGRCAHISKPNEIHIKQGRGQCLNRTECERGCPFGGYFNANGSTIPWALKTGNLDLRPFSVVHSIIYDKDTGKASGVRVIDSNTKEMTDYFAKVIFLNAGAINTAAVLLNSTSERFPNGLGNDSDLLGKYMAFHNYRATISATVEGFKDKKIVGRLPTEGYVPRFRNVYRQETDFLRGYAAGFGARRNKRSFPDAECWGDDLRENILGSKPKLGPWTVGSHMMGETIPKEESYVKLDDKLVDAWGIPQIRISMDYDDNDEKMIKDYHEQFTHMFEKAGFVDIKARDNGRIPGNDIHEMGGVRMGRDPKTSLLNKWNQLHACDNVYVTDGACMTSTSTQNPSLTYMAFAARAANHAVEVLKKGEI